MKEFKLTIKDSALAFISSFILCQLGAIILSVLVMTLSTSLGTTNEQYETFMYSSVGTLLSMLITNSVMIGVYFYFKRKDNAKILCKPNLKKSIIYIIIAIVSFMMLYPIIHCLDNILYNLGIPTNGIKYELNTTNYLISIISFVALPAICEELLFRGLILRGLKSRGKSFAIIISSIMFSLYHISIYQTIYPLMMGLLFALVMYKENNIFYTIIMHAVNNFLSLTLMYCNITFVFNHWTYLLLAIVMLITFTVFIILKILKNNKNSRMEKLSVENKFYLITSLAIMLSIWIAYNTLLINL